MKLKGCYVFGDDLDIHKNHSMQVVARVAVKILGGDKTPIIDLLKVNTNVYDFLISVKLPKSNQLWLGDELVQNTSRFLITNSGFKVSKIMPSAGVEGHYKKKNGVSKGLYLENDNTIWNPLLHSGRAPIHNTRTHGIRGHFMKLPEVDEVEYQNQDNSIFNPEIHIGGGKVHTERKSFIFGGYNANIKNDNPTLHDVNYAFYEKEVLKIIW